MMSRPAGAVRIDVRPQHRIHARQMPVTLLLKPLEHIAIDAEMHRRFAGGTMTRALFQN
jgi:hypothetical protein